MPISPKTLKPVPFPRAFTLIELMVVMAIIGILAVVVAPGVGSILGGRSLSKAADDLTGAIEFARQEAMARQTYVWLGFSKKQTGAAGNSTGVPIVQAGLMASKDGTVDAAAANLRPLSRLMTIPGVVLIDRSELSSVVKGLFGSEVSQGVLSSTANLEFSSGVTLQNVLTFAPDGSVMIGIPSANDVAAIGFSDAIDLNLRQAKSDSPPSTAADMSIVLHGGNGRIHVYRPN